MVLEAAVVVLDNSEYSRNGDLNPSRWDSQLEAINLLSNVVLQSNMESGLGLISAGGKQVRLLMTPTNDSNLILGQCDKIKQQGSFHFSVAIQQASLALKHRINKKQAMRIVAFVASPIDEEEAVLESLAKRLKKNNIAVDIINFGEQNESHLQKLDLFFKTVQKGNNSQLVNLQPGSNIYDLLFSAFSSGGGGQANFQDEGNQQQQQPNQVVNQFLEYGGIDPNTDPELAMAMKISLEEAQNQPADPQPQQQQQQQQQIQEEGFEGIEEEDNEDEALLKKAKDLSKNQEEKVDPKAAKKENKKDSENLFKDPDFLKELIDGADEEEIKKLIQKKKDDGKE